MIKKPILTIHAGHNSSKSKIGQGAVGYVNESQEARNIVKYVKKYLKTDYTVYDTTVDFGCSVTDNLIQICRKTEQYKKGAFLNISVHLNAYKKAKKDGKIKGSECWIYPNSTSKDYAENVLLELNKLGFTNRGVKYSTNLFVLKHTTQPTLLIECFFCDDEDDVIRYKTLGAKKIGKAIADGINNTYLRKESDI